MINWILQKNLTKPEVLERIKSALTGPDEMWEEVEVVPFSNEVPEISHRASRNIVYGSTTFMLNAYQDKDLRAGVFFDPRKFRMSHYVSQWGKEMLNADGTLLAFDRIRELNSTPETNWFIRPDSDGKEFAGKVLSYAELVNWSEQICALDLPDLNADTEVWISPPKTIDKEWRLFIVDDEIVSVSRYMHRGELDESATDQPPELLQFARARIDAYRLDDVYVMDIARLGNAYKLIECNCFNGTGFYRHDVEQVIRSVNRFLRKKINEPQNN
ncbi:ATP-grasp domain-containing protein [Flavilitoribacter nigricans]|uniref:ATP-grasp domain-containing protein n=1 Tax=Flavilitoribacter nigricans (strain ATCC 23147 / DSM 23189 / NBRC 102662 / NCIMB 1420 / SS-2) TaxID=1122177 RepID=A0A2D0NC37_FLAN2|nr:ATP-grasp domain-containing protein [Flavilitoribacter nigricans]PHN06072.1 hypothetical protein CRP01_13970 [Flavilitoribacter nigricans DSM 23189 = NBRC 102662]